MWPLSLVSDIVKICVYLMLSKALKILKTKCHRSLLVSSDVRPNLCNLSSYDKLLSFVINRVALFCTFSNRSMSCFRYSRHACTQYSSFGLTKDWYSFNIILLSLFTNVLHEVSLLSLAFFSNVFAVLWANESAARIINRHSALKLLPAKIDVTNICRQTDIVRASIASN